MNGLAAVSAKTIQEILPLSNDAIRQIYEIQPHFDDGP
jgi:hypothetical protein